MIDWILDQGHLEAPREACGVAVKLTENRRRVFRLPNTAADPCRHFSFHTKELHEVLQGFRQDQVIIWHTHPGGTVGPSDTDLDEVIDGVSYLVVAIPGGEATWYGKAPQPTHQ